MLDARQISTRYGSVQVHWNVAISVADSECIALIGPNGAGKSTLLKVLSGMLRAPGARITFAGEEISRLSTKAIVRRGLIQVPEGRHIFGTLSVAENLQLAAPPRTPKQQFRRDLEYVFQLFPILRERQHRSGAELSGGQQQMLAIARGLVAKPRLLALDEPTLGLAPVMVEQLIRTLAQIRDETGLSMLLVEQHAGVLKELVSRIYVMRTGRVVAESETASLTDQTLKELYMGTGNEELPSDTLSP